MAEKDGHMPPKPRVVRVRGNVARAARFDANRFALASMRIAPSRRARRGGGEKAGEGARPARYGFFPLAQAALPGDPVPYEALLFRQLLATKLYTEIHKQETKYIPSTQRAPTISSHFVNRLKAEVNGGERLRACRFVAR